MKKGIQPTILIVFVGLIMIFHACTEERTPTLTTSSITNITGITATGGGNITDEGSGTVIARGVCWSTGISPTIKDSKTIDGAGVGSFISDLTGLTEGTAYYARAYATNQSGTGYGMTMSFTTLPINCKTCKKVTYENGTIINTGDEKSYCGLELLTILNSPPVVVGSITTKWECR